jgi:hypothetical protein
MPALWSYPWTLSELGLENSWSKLHEIGAEAINLASHYHSVRALQPRLPENLFVSYPGGCYFVPSSERFDDSPISPIPNDVPGLADPVREITKSATDADIDVNAWVVLSHNSRLGGRYPEYRLESAFGDPQDHTFCPSHPEVREYYAKVVEAVAARGVAEVQLESVGYGTVFHGHGLNFGHDKRQVLSTPVDTWLLSQCFCDGCRSMMSSHAVNLAEARETVRDLIQSSFANPDSNLPPVSSLIRENPVLQDLFDFRAAVVSDLFERLAEAAGDTRLNYYVMEGTGLDVGDIWLSGVRFADLTRHMDTLTALCYVGDSAVARQRIAGISRLFDGSIDAGITLDQDAIRSRAALSELVEQIRPRVDGRIHYYHHSLATDAQLEWIRSVS